VKGATVCRSVGERSPVTSTGAVRTPGACSTRRARGAARRRRRPHRARRRHGLDQPGREGPPQPVVGQAEVAGIQSGGERRGRRPSGSRPIGGASGRRKHPDHTRRRQMG
jgi:hypothetical protein